jgi:uncharacterized membrane protein YhaH (DUF805 family)
MERDRFWIIAGILFLIFCIFMAVVWIKADALTHNACQICAAKMGDKVICTTGTSILSTRTFYPNYTIVDGGGYG